MAHENAYSLANLPMSLFLTLKVTQVLSIASQACSRFYNIGARQLRGLLNFVGADA